MKTVLNIKIDRPLKQAAKRAAEEVGVPLGTIVNAFLRQFARDKEVTFSVSYKPTKYLRSILAEAEQEFKDGKAAGPFETVDQLMKHLNA